MKTLLFLPILFTLNASAQKPTHTVEELKKLGRDSLIKMAIREINDTAFHAQYYDVVEVRANKTSVEVDFSLSIRFHSGKKCFYEHVYVGLLNGPTGKSSSGECDEMDYYKPSKKLQKKIDFVFSSINKSSEVGPIPNNTLPAGTKMDITEYTGYYYVEVSDDITYSHYKVDRNTGKISEAGSKEYAGSPDTDKWEIISK
jgi:hypothetical protein